MTSLAHGSQDPGRTKNSPVTDLPPLTTTPLTTDEDRKAALHLITDSIAQQRNIAAQSIIVSPAFIAFWVALIAVVAKYKYHELSDIGIVATSGSGITMALLLFVRWCCEGYVGHAETVASQGLEWFEAQKRTDEDEVMILGSKYGGELIGTLAMRLPSRHGKQERFSEPLPKVEVVAWTVRLRFRHKEIGRGLLEETVKIARERYGKDVKIMFSKEHANSKVILPRILSKRFMKSEKKAEKMLEEVVAEARSEDVADLMQ